MNGDIRSPKDRYYVLMDVVYGVPIERLPDRAPFSLTWIDLS